jgi:tight adherence protein B
MIQALALSSLVLLLLAGAIELWRGGSVRQQQRQSLQNIEERLLVSYGGERRMGEALPSSAPTRTRAAQHADALLMRAGLPTDRRIFITMVVPGVLLTLLIWWRVGSIWATPLMAGLYGGGLWLWLRARIEKQQSVMLRQLPDFLDGMIRMASIGNSLPMAFQSTTKSVNPPLRAVLDRTLNGMHSGQDLDQALLVASRPYALEELALLQAVLGIGMRIGGRADQILQRMSDFMRDHSHARAELLAVTSETRMSGWVLGLLPVAVAAFMTLVNPTFFMPMFQNPLGHKLLLIALVLELFGSMMLYRLAKSL